MNPPTAFRASLLECQGSLTRSRRRFRTLPLHLGAGIRVAQIGWVLGILVILLVFTEQATAQTLTVSPTNLTIGEGSTGTYTVALTAQPSADVTVTVTAADAPSRCGDGHGASCRNKSGVATVDKTSLTFTTTDWSVAQTVTVTATDEDMAGIFKFAEITNQVSGGGNSVTVLITVTDDDSRGVTHYQMASDGTVGTKFAAISLYEGHGDSGFYIELNTEPTATTTVTPTSRHPDSLSVTSEALTFTPENWNTPQLVTFTLIDNLIDDGQKGGGHFMYKVAIDLTPSGTGSDYVGQGLVPFTVSFVDDDTRGVEHYEVASDGTSLGDPSWYESLWDYDREWGFYIELTSEPTATTTVTATSTQPEFLTVISEPLTFTSENWNTPQPVRFNLVGNEIDEEGKGVHRIRKVDVELTPSGTDSDYDGESLTSFPVYIWNDDVAGIALSPTALTISEGEEAQYTVKLSSEPTTSVTVELSGLERTTLTLDKTSLTFTPANWRVPQTVMVTADEDADGEDETVTLAHTSSGGEYDELTANLPSMVVDVNAWPAVSASCDPCTVSWGRPVTLATTASDPDGDPLSYEWSAPRGHFEGRTDASTNVWRAPSEVGYVAIQVQISDGQGGSVSAVAAVEVVNAAPQFLQSVRFKLPENRDGRSQPVELGQLTASDLDGDSLTYSLVSGDRDLFTVGDEDGALSYVGPAKDFETDPDPFDLTVRVRDGLSAEARADVIVTVVDVNEPPNALASCDPCEVPRGGAVRLTMTASDPDGDVLACKWNAPNGHFVGRTDSTVAYWIAPDEAGHTTISAAVVDGRSGSAFATVDVEAFNAAPQFGPDVYHFELQENLDGRQRPIVLGQLRASDPDGDALTYSLVSGDRERFYIRAEDGVVTYVGPGEDFETGPGRYDLTVQAQDAGGAKAEATVYVVVTDVNEEPAVSVSCDPCTVSRGGEVRLAAMALDPEGDVLTYEWTAPDGRFGGRTDSSAVRWTAPDVIRNVTISVRAADGRGGSSLATVGVKVVNAAPVFSHRIYPFELAENLDGRSQPVKLGQLTVSDPDGDALSYSLVSGDRSRFTVGVEDGVVTYVGPGEDFETGPDRYDLMVRARDAVGGKAEAEVTVTITDVNEEPAVLASCDPCAVSRGGEVRLTATASDPDGDVLTYEWSAPNGHFSGRADSSAVRWTAPDVAGSVIIRVEVADGQGGLASATTEVNVVNAAPRFSQSVYSFELAEHLDGRQLPVELGQLTASDPDGDMLTYSLMSRDENRFAIRADNGVVTYIGPGEDFETGPSQYDLMVQARDAAGGEAQAEVTITVTDVNEAPVAIAIIPDQMLDEGGSAVEVTLSPYFADGDGDDLTYHAQSSDPHVVQAAVTSMVLTLTPVVYGSATVTVTAEDTEGLQVTQSLHVQVSDGPQRALLENMLAATVRAHLASVRMTIGRRVNANHCESPRLTVRGRPVPLGRAAMKTSLNKLVTDARSATAQALSGRSRASYRAVDEFTMPMSFEPGSGRSAADRQMANIKAVPMQVLGFGGSGVVTTGTTELVLLRGTGKRSGCRAAPPLVLWSQGGLQSFRGKPETYGYKSNYDGNLWTGYVGLDARLGKSWLAGLALSRSRGTGDWRVGTSDGELTQTMVAIHPFLRWANESTSVWALVGRGKGNAENLRTAGRMGTSALDLRLGLVELETSLGRSGKLGFSLMGDASWAELKTEDGEESVDGQHVRVNQVRIGTKSSVPIGGGLSLSGEVHARRDGGAGPNGYGMELVGGLRAGQGVVRLNAQARMLVLHSATGYREWGSALTLTVGKPGAEGLSMTVSPQWGDAATGVGSLWKGSLDRDFQSPGGDRWTLDARANYAIAYSKQRRLDIFATYNLSFGEPSFGLRLGLPDGSHHGP
ncbi:MAG: tandem-95 repeat protein [Rhodothermaceae bacterium]|nr:tandem-95 repeat protein [Rhodothermaceae bacterium]MYD68041.1 tandem-95 repeat protein [Rhodothermaceae bacterium]MYJ08631.1 tandem-95 repeat protein [Rhodothermaceae bacterium]